MENKSVNISNRLHTLTTGLISGLLIGIVAAAISTLPWIMGLAAIAVGWAGLHFLALDWPIWTASVAFAVGFAIGCWMELNIK